MQLVSKISNLCDHNPPTLQTDGQTDDMWSQDRALHWSALCGKNYKYKYILCTKPSVLAGQAINFILLHSKQFC